MDKIKAVSLPLIKGADYLATEEKIDEWQEIYPAAEVRRELLKMRTWLLVNPSRKKTRKGIERFIITWLSKEQDKGAARAPAKNAWKKELTAEEQEFERILRTHTPKL